jgi:hypothetical protein
MMNGIGKIKDKMKGGTKKCQMSKPKVQIRKDNMKLPALWARSFTFEI